MVNRLIKMFIITDKINTNKTTLRLKTRKNHLTLEISILRISEKNKW